MPKEVNHNNGDQPKWPLEKDKDDLINNPVIIALICGVGFICAIVLIFVIYKLCKKHLRNHDRPPRCHCRHAYEYPGMGYNTWPHPPPSYYPPEGHRCSCQARFDAELHLPTPRYHPPYVETENHGRYLSGDRGLNEFPLLQTPSRDVLNPVYNDDTDDHETETHSVSDDRLADLYKRTERSFTQTVCGKLIVSVARYVDHHGDTLILDNMGISLRVPEGAVKRGQKQRITLVLNWDLSDNPQMTKQQSLVSPVVYVGPHGLKLEKPCTLSYRHCSFDTRHIRVMRSETELIEDKSWEVICDRDDKSGMCYLTQDECQLKIEKFTLYTCVQSPIDNQIGKKWLQIAVFACPLRREINHHQIRVYFLNKTPCALQWAILNEAGFGGKLVCPEKVFLFDGGEYDMFAKTRYISDGWELVDQDSLDKISFLSIWHGQCPHISVCYRRRALKQHQGQGQSQGQGRTNHPVTTVAIEMSLQLLTYQNSLEDNGEKIFIQVAEDNVTPVTDSEMKYQEKIEININNILSQNIRASNASSAGVSQVVCETADSAYARDAPTSSHVGDAPTSPNAKGTPTSQRIRVNINNVQCRVDFLELAEKTRPRTVPHELRYQLVVLLDPQKHVSGNDWRQLAGLLELDSCIPKLETFENPTDHLLNVAESKNISIEQLKDMFRTMKREDCVQTIESYLGEREHMITREPVESSYSGYQLLHQRQTGNQRNISSQMSWDDNSRPSDVSRVNNSIPKSASYTNSSFNARNPSDHATYYLDNTMHQNWSFGERRATDNSDETGRKQMENKHNRAVWSVERDRVTSERRTYEMNNLSDPHHSRDNGRGQTSRRSNNNARTNANIHY